MEPLFDAFAIVGLSGSQPLTTVHGEKGFCGVDARYTPVVLDIVPREYDRKAKLPPQFALCCLPAGVELVPASADPAQLMPRVYSVVLTEEDGTRLYVSCLAFFEDVPAGVACQHRQAAGMRASRAMCLMSHQPYLTSMELSLRTLYASTFITGPTCAVPDSIAMLLRVPAPRPLAHTQHPGLSQPPTPGNRGSQGHVGASAGGAESPFAAAHATALHAHGNEGSQGGPEHGPHGAQQGAEEAAGAQGSGHSNSEGGAAKPQAVQVEFTLEGRPFRLLPPAPATGLPQEELPLRPLMEVLSVDNVVTLFVAVLLERRVLLRASHYRLLVLAGEGVRQLLYPLRHLHTYIPVMPWVLVDYCEAPTPFLMGLHAGADVDSGGGAGRAQEQLVMVDLDADTVAVRGEDLTPFLAHPAVTRLRTRLRHLLSPATAVGDAVIGPQLGAHHHYQHTHLGPVAAGQGAGGWDAAGTVAARVAAAGGEEDPWLRRAAEMSCTGWSVLHDNLVRRLFLQCMSALLRGYHAFLTTRSHAGHHGSNANNTGKGHGRTTPDLSTTGGAELLVVGRESSVSSILGGVARSSASRTGQLPFDSASFVAWHVTHSRAGGSGGVLLAALTQTLSFYNFIEEYGKGGTSCPKSDPYAWYKGGCDAFAWAPSQLRKQHAAYPVHRMPAVAAALLRPAKQRPYASFPPLHMVEAGLMVWEPDKQGCAASSGPPCARPLQRVSSSARLRAKGISHRAHSRSLSGDVADTKARARGPAGAPITDDQALLGAGGRGSGINPGAHGGMGAAMGWDGTGAITPTSSIGLGLTQEMLNQLAALRYGRTSTSNDSLSLSRTSLTSRNASATNAALQTATLQRATPILAAARRAPGDNRTSNTAQRLGGGRPSNTAGGNSPGLGAGHSGRGVVEAELVRRQTGALLALLELGPGAPAPAANVLEGMRALLRLQLGGNGMFLVARLREALGLGPGHPGAQQSLAAPAQPPSVPAAAVPGAMTGATTAAGGGPAAGAGTVLGAKPSATGQKAAAGAAVGDGAGASEPSSASGATAGAAGRGSSTALPVGERSLHPAAFGVMVDAMAAILGAAICAEDWGTVAAALQVSSCLTKAGGAGAAKERVVHHLGTSQPLLFSVWVWCGVVGHILASANTTAQQLAAAAAAEKAERAAHGETGESGGKLASQAHTLAAVGAALAVAAAHLAAIGVGEGRAWELLQWLAYTHVSDAAAGLGAAASAHLFSAAGDVMAGVRSALKRAKLAARGVHRSRLLPQEDGSSGPGSVDSGGAGGLQGKKGWPPLELFEPGASLRLPRGEGDELSDAAAVVTALAPPPSGWAQGPMGPADGSSPPVPLPGADRRGPQAAGVAGTPSSRAASMTPGAAQRPPWQDLRPGASSTRALTPRALHSSSGAALVHGSGTRAARAGSVNGGVSVTQGDGGSVADRSARTTTVSEDTWGAVVAPLSPAVSPSVSAGGAAALARSPTVSIALTPGASAAARALALSLEEDGLVLDVEGGGGGGMEATTPTPTRTQSVTPGARPPRANSVAQRISLAVAAHGRSPMSAASLAAALGEDGAALSPGFIRRGSSATPRTASLTSPAGPRPRVNIGLVSDADANASGDLDDVAPERDAREHPHDASMRGKSVDGESLFGDGTSVRGGKAVVRTAWGPGGEDAARKAAAYFGPVAPAQGTGGAAVATVVSGGGPIMCLDAAARLVVVGSEEGELRLLRARDGRVAGVAKVHLPAQALPLGWAGGRAGGCGLVRLAADGSMAAYAGAADHGLGVVDCVAGRVATRLLPCHAARVSVLHMGAGGALLLSGSADDGVRVWDVRCPNRGGGVRGAAAAGVSAGQRGVSALLVDGARLQIVSGGRDGSVKVWDLRRTSAPLRTLTGHSGPVTALMAGPSNAAGAAGPPPLISASTDWTLRVWEGEGEGGGCQVLAGHGGAVSTLALVPDADGVLSALGPELSLSSSRGGGGYAARAGVGAATRSMPSACAGLVVSGAEDGSVAVWRLGGGPPVCAWLGGVHSAGVGLLAAGPGGCLVSGALDGSVCAWVPPPLARVEAATSAEQPAATTTAAPPVATATPATPVTAQAGALNEAVAAFASHRSGPPRLLGHHVSRGVATCLAFDAAAGVVYSGGHRGLLHAWAPDWQPGNK